MSTEWYEGLPDDYFESDADRVYKEAFASIREGIAQGLSFDEACRGIDISDDALRDQIIADMLKVLIAEEHFARQVRLDELAKQLQVAQERLESVKKQMLEEVQTPPLKNFYSGSDAGNI